MLYELLEPIFIFVRFVFLFLSIFVEIENTKNEEFVGDKSAVFVSPNVGKFFPNM